MNISKGFIGATACVLCALLVLDEKLLEISKDVFRMMRSEVHLAHFYLLRNVNSIPSIPLLPLAGQNMIFIAHGTGQVEGKQALNSIEGLNSSTAKGCRYIEVDLIWTSDHQLVSSHDWVSFFGDPLQVVPDLNTFKQRHRSDGFTQMTFDDLNKWLVNHPAINLVTDVKVDNLKALEIFLAASSFQQIIPQVYSFAEFARAKKMGFENIILTTYLTYYSNSSLRRFVEEAHPAAVTVPVSRLSSELLAIMATTGVPILTHPVPRRSDLESLPAGVKGIYSMSLCK